MSKEAIMFECGFNQWYQAGRRYRSSCKVRKTNSGVSDIKSGVHVSQEDITKDP